MKLLPRASREQLAPGSSDRSVHTSPPLWRPTDRAIGKPAVPCCAPAPPAGNTTRVRIARRPRYLLLRERIFLQDFRFRVCVRAMARGRGSFFRSTRPVRPRPHHTSALRVPFQLLCRCALADRSGALSFPLYSNVVRRKERVRGRRGRGSVARNAG